MQCGRGLLERVEDLRELLYRLVQVVEVQDERGDDADGDGAVGREVRAEADDERERQPLDELDDSVVRGSDALGADARAVLLAAGVDEVADGPIGLVERLDDTHPCETLLQRGERAADTITDAQVRTSRHAAVPHGRDDEDRAHEQHDDPELPAEDEHRDERRDDQHAAHHEHRQSLADEVLERLHVGRHARHEQAGSGAIEEAHRHAHDVVEHATAQIEQERLAGLRYSVDRRAAEDVRAGGRDDEEQRREGDRVDVALRDALVDAEADQRRAQRHQRRPDRG